MKKSLILASSFLFIFLGIFLISRREEEIKKNEVPIKKFSKNLPLKKDFPIPLKHSPRQPAQNLAEKKEEVIQDKRENFNREKITWIKENLFYVRDLSAHHKKDPLISPLFEGDGFYFYESQIKEGSEVVFNPENNRYGVYTKEITVKGDLKRVSEFASSKNWKILYQNEMLKTSIIRVNQLEDTSMLTELEENSRIRWNLGVIYSRPISK